MSRRRRTALASVLDAVTAALPDPVESSAGAAQDAGQGTTAAKAPPASTAKAKHTSLYLPPAALRQLKELALLDDCKPHDIIVAALDAYFERRGRPSVAELRQRED